MGNKKVLSKATRELNKTKRFATPKNIIEDPRGQWAHPGEITRIPSDKITMQGVPYPVMAYPNMGEPQMMYPGQDYVFPGADYVDEYPQMQEGGTTIPIIEDAGSMHEDGFWVPDWEAIAMQAKQLNAKTVKTKSGAIIYFDDNWQVQSVDENPQMKKGGTPKSLVKMPKPSKKGLASKKFSRSLEATNRLFTENPLFAKPKSKKRKVFDPNAQYQDGGEPGDKFKKRLMKRYPGMQDVYGAEGENLNIVKDPNYDARSVGYGDIEFQFPEGNPVITYPNRIEKGGPEYIYPNPSPDKYTALYNPRGANRGDIFLDMMHGMRDDPNYQPLLQNFEKAVRDARGGDMSWYYEDDVKNNSYSDGQEQWDANYLDGQLRAQLAPGSIGMFSKGRRDYRQERKYDSPEMRAAAEDIRNYLKGKPAEEEYQEGGMTAPLDLDPKTMKRYLADLKDQENNIKKGYRGGKWYPHPSPEGGLDTIAYGHKLTSRNSPYYQGISDEQAEALLLKDVLQNQALAKKQVDAEFGEGTFDSLPQDRQMLLVDYQYNLGTLAEFPKFVKAVVEGDTKTMIAEHTRYGGKDSLTRRNQWTLNVIDNLTQPIPEKPSNGITIPLANVPDATNVVLPQIEGGPEGAIELELSPEEIEQYQMGGYIVEDVDDTDSPAAPCPPGKIYDPIIQGCVDESIYRLNRQVQKDSINVDDAIRENRRYYKGYKFIQDWQNSPMYDKMLKESARSPESYEYMKKMRQQQLESTPPLQILPQPEDSPNTGGQSWSGTGQIEIFPAGFRTRGTHSHELSHSSDRPVRGKRSRLIPQRDIDYVNKNKAKTIADSRAYHNYKDEYDPMFKEYPEYKQQVDDSFKSFSTDYVGDPTEVRARLNAIRQLSKEAGLYDPFTQGVSPDLYYKKLKNYQFEKGDKSGFDPMRQLQDTFSDEEIIWLLNNMSKTEDNKPELNVAQEGGSPDPKTNFYTVEGSGGVYRKVNGKWEVDWNRSGNFQPLSKGDVKKRAAVLDKKAKPLYDSTYDDIYTTQNTAYTAPPKASAVKPTVTKKLTAQDKAAQEQFDKAFAVPIKSKKEIVEDKIQKGIDDYVKYHQQQTGKPLTQEEYDDAYQDIYNRAYVDAGVYKPTMSGPTINPYGTTEERKNLVSLDPGKAPKNLTLGDYVDKGWDVVTNPLDYASYALKPKGTVTTPWNMTNYENRLEAAGLEDPVTANNNVNKAIDFASYFIGPGMVAQGLKMVPGTVNSIGRAFKNPSWENTGDALFDAGMTALFIAPGFGIAKNLAKPASTLDDLRAIEALRGNTATTPFQSYYLTGNRALNASEAAIPQAQGLRRFIDPQSPQLPAGRSPIMSESTKTQLTNPAVDSYFPVRFGDESYAAAGNEQYFVDPEDYRLFNPETKQFEDNPNWKQEGLTNYWNYANREGKRGTGPDFFKGINYEFKDFSPGWQAARDAKDLIMPAQRMPKKSDYFTRKEFYDMLEQEMQYKILDDERKIQEALTGKKITDAEFAEMNPGVTRPDFTKKMLTEEHRRAVNDLLRDNPSVKSNPLLKENLEAAVARSERRENALPISVTIRQDLEKYPPETLINLYGKQYAGVLPEQVASLSPKQLEKTKQTIIDNIAKGMSKAEEDFAKKNPFRPGDNPMSLNLAADTPGQLPSLTRTPKEMKAIDDLRKLHSRTRTGQSNAEDVFNRLKTQKLKDLDTPDGRRRIQEHIDDNNIIKSDYVESNYDEISKRYDLRDILTNPNHEKHQVAVEGLKEELIRKGKNPSDYKLNSWDELTGDAILSNMRLYLNADEVVAKSYPDYFGGFIERPITTDEYIDHIKLLDYSNPEKNIKFIENRIATERKRISNLRAKRDELLKDYQKGDVSLDRYRRIKSGQEADILRAEQEILSMKMNIYWMKQDLERSNASYNFGPHTIGIGDPLTAIGDLQTAVYHETGHGTDLAFLKNEKEGSKIDRDLLDEIVLAKEAPAHITQKLDLDAMSQASPYTTSKFSISKAQNPIAYWEQARNYFKGAEPTAFAVELRPLLREAGLIKNDFDKVTPEMVKELYQDYITKPVWETGTRIFDIIEPVKQSFKAISKALNKIKGMAPYAIPVGLGVGATGLAGQEAIQEDMEYQSGGIIMELSDDEIQQYANGGFVVEELEYRPDAGKTLDKKVASKPKTTINTEGLAYRPSASTKPQNPNAKANVQTNPSQQRQQNVQVPKPKVITDSMSTVLDKYAIGDTSPIMSIDVFQDIVTKQNQEKQAKLELLQRQLEASQAGTSNPNPAKRKQPSIKQYEFTEEFIKGMPNVRTEQSESYLGGRPLKNEVKKVVLHHTGSTDEKNNNKYVHNHFMNPDSETSAHVVIEEDGTRTVYASPDQVTFHAGKSTWDGRTNVNDFGVGIEFQGDTNVKPLTSAQIRSFVEYFDQLAKKYNVSTQDIITHAMIAPGRKPDITESQYKRILKYLKERGYE